jgi:RNA polymerase sigma factor (sigma-70 family)
MRKQDVEDSQTDFADFYRSSRDACLRAVAARTGNRSLAEELVAESFTRALASWPRVRRHPAPQAWIVRSALNAHVSRWRRRKREVPLDQQDLASEDSRDDMLSGGVLAALRRLPTRQQEVITLRILLDLDTNTAAKVLGIAPGTVMTHLSRAIAALRADMRSSPSESFANSEATK